MGRRPPLSRNSSRLGENGSPKQMLASLQLVHKQATDALTDLCDMADGIVEGQDQFPERRATNAVTIGALHADLRDHS